jgi:hypothetical protein
MPTMLANLYITSSETSSTNTTPSLAHSPTTVASSVSSHNGSGDYISFTYDCNRPQHPPRSPLPLKPATYAGVGLIPQQVATEDPIQDGCVDNDECDTPLVVDAADLYPKKAVVKSLDSADKGNEDRKEGLGVLFQWC